MAYFLKKSKLKKGIYLQIYESFYDPARKQTAHKSFKSLGYVNELEAKGIEDPVNYYKSVVKKMNEDKAHSRTATVTDTISTDESVINIGYFPIKAINDGLKVNHEIDNTATGDNPALSTYDMISSMVYSNSAQTGTENKSIRIYTDTKFKLNDIYRAIESGGAAAEDIKNCYYKAVNNKYGFSTDRILYYHSGIYHDTEHMNAMGRSADRKILHEINLVFDNNTIPLNMEMIPESRNNRDFIFNTINKCKEKYSLKSRVIHISNMWPACLKAVDDALENDDGYLYTKQMKNLSQSDKAWLLKQETYENITDATTGNIYRIKERTGNFAYQHIIDSVENAPAHLSEKRIAVFDPVAAKEHTISIRKKVEKARSLIAAEAATAEFADVSSYITYTDSNESISSNKIILDTDSIRNDLQLAGYTLIVTSELSYTGIELIEISNTMRRASSTLQEMKDLIISGPDFFRKHDTSVGLFLISYIGILLERILKHHILQNRFSNEIMNEFISSFNIIQTGKNSYINLLKDSNIAKTISDLTGLPLRALSLSERELKNIISYKF